MKKLILTCAALIAMQCANSQQVKGYKPSSEGIDANATLYGLPMTTLKIRVQCERQNFVAGVYAKFAEKYLGIEAATQNKTTSKITGAQINYFEEIDPSKIYALDNVEKSPLKPFSPTVEGYKASQIERRNIVYDRFSNKVLNENPFPDRGITAIIGQRQVNHKVQSVADTSKFTVNVTEMEFYQKSVEEQAESAAKVIFMLRSRRMELITGDAGEYVFGAGLGAALEEIKRLEANYVSLFLGKTTSETIVKEYEICPDANKSSMVVGKISDADGLLNASDNAGSPITIEFTPEKKTAAMEVPKRSSKSSNGTYFYRVADIVACKLVENKKVITADRIPIYQYGTIVELPVPSNK